MSQGNHLVIHCSDFFLIDEMRMFMEERGLMGDCEVIAIPGSVGFLKNPEDSEALLLLKQIERVVMARSTKRMYIVAHTGCSYLKYSTREAEAQGQKALLESSRALLASHYPDLHIVKVVGNCEEDGTTWFEEVNDNQ